MRLDPGSELIALIRLRQPEPVLAAQLERSKDVLAQSAAIAGLAAIRPVTYGVVNALRACMQNSSFYCRCACCALLSELAELMLMPSLYSAHKGRCASPMLRLSQGNMLSAAEGDNIF